MPCLYHFTEILREEMTQDNPYKCKRLIYKDFSKFLVKSVNFSVFSFHSAGKIKPTFFITVLDINISIKTL